MRIPKNYFANLNADQYKQYLKLLPDMHNEKTQAYVMLGFTLLALSFFGLFAINPTLTTITNLKKQLEDSKFVDQQLNKKIQDLETLQGKYTIMSADLPYLYDAIPKAPIAPTLLAQVQALAQQNHLQLSSLRTFEVELSQPTLIRPNGSSYAFSLEATGAYDNMMSFATALTHFNRIVSLELFSISKDPKLETLDLDIRGRAYYTTEE